MQQQDANTAQMVIGSVLVVMLFLIVIWGGLAALKYLSGDATLTTALVAAVFTAAGAVVTTFISKRSDRRAAIEAKLREKKVPAYEKAIKLVYGTVAATLEKKDLDEKELREKVFEVMEQLTIWGTNETVGGFVNFKKSGSAVQTGKNPREILDPVADMILAIRKDLGHSTKGIDRKTILGMFVGDVDEYYK